MIMRKLLNAGIIISLVALASCGSASSTKENAPLAEKKNQLQQLKQQQEKLKNLCDQQIGTEVQLLNYKAQLESLEKQLATLNEQLSYTNVYAEMAGIAEDVTIRVGEFFSGNPQQGGYIRLVNTNSLKAL